MRGISFDTSVTFDELTQIFLDSGWELWEWSHSTETMVIRPHKGLTQLITFYECPATNKLELQVYNDIETYNQERHEDMNFTFSYD